MSKEIVIIATVRKELLVVGEGLDGSIAEDEDTISCSYDGEPVCDVEDDGSG